MPSINIKFQMYREFSGPQMPFSLGLDRIMETQTDVQLVSKYLDLMRLGANQADWAFVWADRTGAKAPGSGFTGTER